MEGKSGSGIDFEADRKIADIAKPLGAVIEMVQAGNRVVFDQDDYTGNNISSIFNKKTQKYIPIDEVGRGYKFDMWIPVGKKSVNSIGQATITKQQKSIEVKNKYEKLCPDFVRQA